MRYKIRDGRAVSLKEMLEFICEADQKSDKPEHDGRFGYKGEFYCPHQHCDVRYVTIDVKFPFGHGGSGKHYKESMECPLCGSLLNFHSFLVPGRVLAPVKGEEGEGDTDED